MITAGEVGAVFKIVDEASPVLRRLSEQFTQFEKKIDRIKRSLGTMFDSVKDSDAVFGRLLGGIDKLGAASEKAGAKFAAAFDGAADKATERIAALRKEIEGIGRIRVNGPRGGSIRYGGAGREAGEIESLDEFRRAWNRGGSSSFDFGDALAGFTGFTPELAVGLGGLALGAKMIREASDLEAVKTRMRLGGVAEPAIDRATAKALELGDRYHVKAAGLLDVENEIRNPLGSTDEALARMDTIAKASRVLQAFGKGAGQDEGEIAGGFYEAVKAAELDNKITGPDFDRFIDRMVKAYIGTGGKVTPREYFQFEKYSRQALQGMDQDFLFRIAPELIQEFGGSSAGTALASLYGQVVGAKMPTRGLRLAEDIGELDASKVEFDKHGRVVRAKPGAFLDAALLQSDPMAFADKIYDKLAANAITDEKAQDEYIAQMFSNRNAANILRVLHDQRARFLRSALGIDHALTPDQAQPALSNDPNTLARGASADFANAAARGGDGLGTTIFNAITRGLSSWFQQGMPIFNPLLPPSYPPNAGKQAIDSIKGALNIPAPTVNTDVKVTANVTLDGRAIAAAVESHIEKSNRVTNSSAEFDGRASFGSPDMTLP
jgi:hypothetical protein